MQTIPIHLDFLIFNKKAARNFNPVLRLEPPPFGSERGDATNSATSPMFPFKSRAI
jgi:hypothetical protein